MFRLATSRVARPLVGRGNCMNAANSEMIAKAFSTSGASDNVSSVVSVHEGYFALKSEHE